MNKIQRDFLKELEEWKKGHWIIFAAQTTRKGDTKRFWCNLAGEYKIALKLRKEIKRKTLYQGDNMEEAYKIYYML